MERFILLSGVLFLYLSVQNVGLIEAVSEANKNEDEIITRTLYMQKPREPIPSYLSERALPRKIQNSEDWLQHYKNLLQNWNSERLRSQSAASEDGTGSDLGGQIQSEYESHIEQPLPTGLFHSSEKRGLRST